ncbi:hypothetical protein SAMN06264364_11872 [Quadrisphaera granulorum]|uniref:Uncharacterized protein n=1 Tax=Quadrisphaera granulorum TaxID=317664 RepID=A0A316A486_9ACTN|nr:MSMEG_6728 family protein [Quadrisphaera granulorum]PWJ52701.1 hypothetical protein BXY45_11872 [Quadrisphaera granulorum]SZE97523.1 hypothetical protein SAMN06264364_11872 [Quadrisphaera granulorum]
MQTFLPFPGFAESAAVLDGPRLGKQRVEVLQVLRALELPEYGWSRHPVVVMWRGRTPALVHYGLQCVHEWTARGHADSTASQIAEFAPEVADATEQELAGADQLPSWLGRPEFHRAHRSNLLRKDTAHYGPLFETDLPTDLDYVWPGPDDVPARPPLPGRGLWVVRAADSPTLGVLVGQGVVGLDTSSGIDVPADLASPGDLRTLLAERGEQTGVKRRPGKALRQLESLVADVAVGDEVAVPVHEGRSLLLGEVTGEYAFAGTAALVPHRRSVRWLDVIPRAALARPSDLQDPRSLFRVTLAL